jgi:hypothetical protein
MMRLKKLARAVDQITGDAVEAVAEPMLDEPPAAKDDGLDWVTTPTGGKWPDGTEIMFTKKKQGGGIDWTGFLFSNGFAGARLMDAGENLLKPIAEAAQKIAGSVVVTPGAAPAAAEHVAQPVNGIPTSAVAADDYPLT